MPVLLIVTFILGVGNFALHQAVLESGHPMFGALRDASSGLRWGLLALEFAVLVVALLLVYRDQPVWGWAYGLYSLANAATAWLVLTRRV